MSCSAEKEAIMWLNNYLIVEKDLQNLNDSLGTYQVLHKELDSTQVELSKLSERIADLTERKHDVKEKCNKLKKNKLISFAVCNKQQTMAHLMDELNFTRSKKKEKVCQLEELEQKRKELLRKEVEAKGKLQKAHELESEHEFCRNQAIASAIQCNESAKAELTEMEGRAKALRIKGTKARLEFSAVKRCKNFLQQADSLCEQALKYLASGQAQRGDDTSLFGRKALEKDLRQVFPTIVAASQNVICAYMFLPKRVKRGGDSKDIPLSADFARSISMPWIDPSNVFQDASNKFVQKHVSGWEHNWLGELGDELAEYVSRDDIAKFQAIIKQATLEMQCIKKVLKDSIEKYVSQALCFEQQMLKLEESVFLDLLATKK